jgi:hypothetical protein
MTVRCAKLNEATRVLLLVDHLPGIGILGLTDRLESAI